MGNNSSHSANPSNQSTFERKRFSLPNQQLSLSNFVSSGQSSKSMVSGFTQLSRVSQVSRPWSKISRRQWQESTLNNPLRASRTAWPVSQIEALFLPEFSIQGTVTLDHFDVKEFIAQGSYGKVYRAIKKDTNQEFAIKILNKSQILAEDLVLQVKAEVKIQSMCGHHPFIVNGPFYWQSHRTLYLGSQYYAGGELLDLIRDVNAPFPEAVARIYVAEIALALDFLHNAGVIYRDLKPENILLDEQGHAHLTDFGLSKWLPLGGRTSTMCGTDKYMAPEIGSAEFYNHAVDWWSLGVLTHVLLTSQYPDEEGGLKLTPHASTGAQNLLQRLLTRDPKMRLRSIMSLEILPFFQGFKFSDVRSKKVSPKKLLAKLTTLGAEPKPPDIIGNGPSHGLTRNKPLDGADKNVPFDEPRGNGPLKVPHKNEHLADSEGLSNKDPSKNDKTPLNHGFLTNNKVLSSKQVLNLTKGSNDGLLDNNKVILKHSSFEKCNFPSQNAPREKYDLFSYGPDVLSSHGPSKILDDPFFNF